jgi:hypothetical protein
MSNIPTSLGNQIFQMLKLHQGVLFDLGRSAQLAYIAFQHQGNVLKENPDNKIKLSYPIGINSDGSVMTGQKEFAKEVLIHHYQHLAEHELCVMCTYHLVTQTEALFTDIATAILSRYPKKLGSKKQTPVGMLFEAPTLEAAREAIITSFCNELGYLSPKEYAENVKDLFGISLMEIPAYHKYLEVKATRDIFIHNRGIVNETYLAKAGSHCRAASGAVLPMNSVYFLQGYECCLSLTECLMRQFNEVWPSEEYNDWKAHISKPQPQLIVPPKESPPSAATPRPQK